MRRYYPPPDLRVSPVVQRREETLDALPQLAVSYDAGIARSQQWCMQVYLHVYEICRHPIFTSSAISICMLILCQQALEPDVRAVFEAAAEMGLPAALLQDVVARFEALAGAPPQDEQDA